MDQQFAPGIGQGRLILSKPHTPLLLVVQKSIFENQATA
jgi:hypothetical protein